jgi:hypothetical protein
MAYDNSCTAAQRRYIEVLAKDLTDEQLNTAIRKTGTSSNRVYGSIYTRRNQRLKYLTKNYASALINLLKDEEYVNSLVAADGHEEEGEN